MRLVRFGNFGSERPGVLDKDGIIRDLSTIIQDISQTTLSPESLEKLAHQELSELPIIDQQTRLGSCVGNVGKFICIGLNYRDHIKESGAEVPVEPVIFMKATSSLSGPNDDIVLPRGSTKTDWEVELAVVIGSRAQYVSECEALNYVAGYAVVNDLSEREYQLERSGQWVKGKSADGFGPLGPWLVTKDEIPDPQNLNLWLEVNGQRFQDGNTADMVFGVAFLISYLSQFMTLHPGDIISTGTPAGVGLGQYPSKYLEPHDKIRLGISNLGEQHQRILPGFIKPN